MSLPMVAAYSSVESSALRLAMGLPHGEFFGEDWSPVVRSIQLSKDSPWKGVPDKELRAVIASRLADAITDVGRRIEKGQLKAMTLSAALDDPSTYMPTP